MSAVVLGAMSIMGVLFVKHGKSSSLLMGYFTTTCQLVQNMLQMTALFLRRTAHWHTMHAAVQLLDNEILNFTHVDYVFPSTVWR